MAIAKLVQCMELLSVRLRLAAKELNNKMQ